MSKYQVAEKTETGKIPMTDFDVFLEKYHLSLDAFAKGDPKPFQALYSRKEDATLANPFGGIMQGWDSIKEATDRGASFYRDGWYSFENIVRKEASQFAYLVEVEHYNSKMFGKNEVSIGSLRVTSVFRKEEGVWKVVHRQADPLTSVQTFESVLNRFEDQN